LCTLCQNLVVLSQLGLKSVYKSRIPPIYDILRDKKFKKFKSPFMTILPENMTMILYMQKYLWVQTMSCVPRVFLPIKIENNYAIKAFFSIVLKHGAKPRTCIWGIFSCQNIISLNLTWIWWLSSKVPKNYYSLAFFLTRFIKRWQKKYLYTVFCFFCKISKSEVTRIWHDSNDMLICVFFPFVSKNYPCTFISSLECKINTVSILNVASKTIHRCIRTIQFPWFSNMDIFFFKKKTTFIAS